MAICPLTDRECTACSSACGVAPTIKKKYRTASKGRARYVKTAGHTRIQKS